MLTGSLAFSRILKAWTRRSVGMLRLTAASSSSAIAASGLTSAAPARDQQSEMLACYSCSCQPYLSWQAAGLGTLPGVLLSTVGCCKGETGLSSAAACSTWHQCVASVCKLRCLHTTMQALLIQRKLELTRLKAAEVQPAVWV